jgi:hypothetical protein
MFDYGSDVFSEAGAESLELQMVSILNKVLEDNNQ